MCLFSTLRKNPKYKANKKNGGVIPAVTDERALWVPTGCGNCIECCKQKEREWSVRLQEDIKTNTNGKFIALTFSNEQLKNIIQGKDTNGKQVDEPLKTTGYILDNQIATIAVRRFNERWRKEFKKAPRHWFVTELGHENTEHLHLHGIIWTDELPKTVWDIWKYGFIFPKNSDRPDYNNWKGNYVNEASIGYITKYFTKRDHQHQYYKPIILNSKGIGRNYTETHNATLNIYKGENTKETYTTRDGVKLALPIYYRNKIYTDEEREKLWMQKLDKEERYVLGNKIKVKNDDKEYWRALKAAQKYNREMGYGSNEKDWDQEQYEREIRMLKQLQRIKA